MAENAWWFVAKTTASVIYVSNGTTDFSVAKREMEAAEGQFLQHMPETNE